MVEGTFVVNAFLGMPLAVACLVIGGKVHRRARVEARPALTWFSMFWVGIGAYALVECMWGLAYLAGFDALALGLFVLHVKIIGLVGAFAGLVAYLLIIHGIDRRALGVIMGGYALVLAITETYYSWRAPVAQVPGAWGMRLLYAVNDTQPWWTIVLLLLLLPPFFAAIAYARLMRHAHEPETRYRIALTSASLMLFFLPMFIGWRAGGFPWWGGVERMLSFLMVTGIALALWPPESFRRRFRGDTPTERDRALRERARLLV